MDAPTNASTVTEYTIIILDVRACATDSYVRVTTRAPPQPCVVARRNFFQAISRNFSFLGGKTGGKLPAAGGNFEDLGT